MYAATGVVLVDRANAARESVVTATAVVVSELFPDAVDSDIPPVANKLVNVLAETDLPVESTTDIAKVAFSPGA